jgi:hypothetical protein
VISLLKAAMSTLFATKNARLSTSVSYLLRYYVLSQSRSKQIRAHLIVEHDSPHFFFLGAFLVGASLLQIGVSQPAMSAGLTPLRSPLKLKVAGL